jgi:NADPH:quinone reductase-like Zn-dependent oxidoreductase
VTATMRAALIRSHGQPPGYQDHPAPRRSAGQAVIRVTAAPVCPLDLLCASGTSYFGKPPLPYAPGAQGVGIVEEADTLQAGQRVWFSCDAGMKPGDGAMAELCLAEESSILPLPGYVADDLVAALGLSAIAAWTALTLRGGLQPGEHVLVLGASGTVGQVGVQAARLLGAGRVTAACRDAHGRARATELGADAVAALAADDAGTLTARLAEAAGGRVDLVLDPVWGMPAEAALRVLSPSARRQPRWPPWDPPHCAVALSRFSATPTTRSATSRRRWRWPRYSGTPRPGTSRPTARHCLWPKPRRAGRDAGSRRTGARS